MHSHRRRYAAASCTVHCTAQVHIRSTRGRYAGDTRVPSRAHLAHNSHIAAMPYRQLHCTASPFATRLCRACSPPHHPSSRPFHATCTPLARSRSHSNSTSYRHHRYHTLARSTSARSTSARSATPLPHRPSPPLARACSRSTSDSLPTPLCEQTTPMIISPPA